MITKTLLLTRAFIRQYWGAVVILFGLLIMFLEYTKVAEFSNINENLQSWHTYLIFGLIAILGYFIYRKQKKSHSR